MKKWRCLRIKLKARTNKEQNRSKLSLANQIDYGLQRATRQI